MALLFSVAIHHSFGQISSNSGTFDWTDPGAWAGGNVPTANDDVIISGNSTIYISTDIVHNANLTVQSNAEIHYYNNIGSLTVNNGDVIVEANGYIHLDSINLTISNGTFQNAGQVFCKTFAFQSATGASNPGGGGLTVFNGATINGLGTVDLNGISVQGGDISIGSGTQLTCFSIQTWSGDLTNDGILVADFLSITGSISNTDSIDVYELTDFGKLTNSGNFEVFGPMNIFDSLLVLSGGTFTIHPSIDMGHEVFEPVHNEGTIELLDTVNFFETVNNYGSFTIDQSLGEILADTMNNWGSVEVNNSQLEVLGSYYNYGALSGSNGEILINAHSENGPQGSMNGTIDVCDLTLQPGTYLDIDNAPGNIDSLTVTFCSFYLDIPENALTSVSVFPSPVEGILTIESSNTGVAEIYALSGQFITQMNLQNGSNALIVSTLSSGAYIVSVELDNGTIEKHRFVRF